MAPIDVGRHFGLKRPANRDSSNVVLAPCLQVASPIPSAAGKSNLEHALESLPFGAAESAQSGEGNAVARLVQLAKAAVAGRAGKSLEEEEGMVEDVDTEAVVQLLLVLADAEVALEGETSMHWLQSHIR